MKVKMKWSDRVLLALYASAGCDVLAMAAVTARLCRKAETPA